MEQQFNLDEQARTDYERIEKKLKFTGYSDEFAPKILEQMARGIKEFVVEGAQPMAMGPDQIRFKTVIGPANKDAGMTVLQAIEAELTKGIVIPNVLLKEKGTGALLVDIPALDERLVKLGSLPQASTADAAHKQLHAQVNQEMQVLMTKLPEVFNLLSVKHNPSLEFAVPEDLRTQQARIIADNHQQATISSFFNLSPLEIYGMMKNGLPVRKLIYPKGQPEIKWFRLSGKTGPDGRAEITFLPTKPEISVLDGLKKYNFIELQTQDGRDSVTTALEKASLMMVTNGNDRGQKHVLIAANPWHEMEIKMYTLDRQPIRFHNDYLKNPLVQTRSDIAALPSASQHNKHGDNVVDAIRKAERPARDVMVGDGETASLKTGKEKQARQQAAPGPDDDSKKKIKH